MLRAVRSALFVTLLASAITGVAAEYRGNRESRVFHQSSCRYFSCKNCTVVLASPEEAANRGFRPCGVCRPSAERETRPAEASYSGNSSSRKFHRSGCRYYSCKNCTAKFKSRDAAIKAGYSPGGCCNP